jgi:hypothetical protein
VTSIISFIWRTGSTDDPDNRPKLSPQQALGPRVALTALFGIGLLYFSLCIITFRSYGNMDGIKWAAFNSRRNGELQRRSEGGQRPRQAGENGRPNESAPRSDAQERRGQPEKSRESRRAHGVQEADVLGLAWMGTPTPVVPGRVRDEVDLEKDAGHGPLPQTSDMGL